MTDLLEFSKELCYRNKISPQKKHGQNFLIDDEAYDDIVEASELSQDDVVLEVGPGLGFLTERLAMVVQKVITVEIDQSLCDFLVNRFESLSIKNVQLISGDILNLARNVKYNKIVANLPYNISAYFLQQYLSVREAPEVMVLMLQKEVVDRICASPGKMSILSVSVQFYAEPSLVVNVSRQSFWPEPNVDSAVVKIVRRVETRRGASVHSDIDEGKFFELVKAGFSSKRKMLKNNLANIYKIEPIEAEARLVKLGFSAKVRAQDLSVDDWKKLLGVF